MTRGYESSTPATQLTPPPSGPAPGTPRPAQSDTLRQALAETVSAAIIRIDDEEDTGRINRASARLYARTAIAVVLSDPTIRRWKAAEETAAYFISQYPTVQLAEEREWDPALDALAKAVTPTASDSTIDSQRTQRPVQPRNRPESTPGGTQTGYGPTVTP